MTRCEWAQANDLLIADHDQHWGIPIHDDGLLFQQLASEADAKELIAVTRDSDFNKTGFVMRDFKQQDDGSYQLRVMLPTDSDNFDMRTVIKEWAGDQLKIF